MPKKPAPARLVTAGIEDVALVGDATTQVQALDSLLGVHSAGTHVGVVEVAPIV